MATLITGKGTSGSWQIRGVQLGQAAGFDAIPNAPSVDVAKYDTVILVKRYTHELLGRVQGRRLIWDTVDSWPQPHGNTWNRAQCMDWLKKEVAIIQPTGIIAATHAMMDDIKGFYSGPVLWLPHHHRPGLTKQAIRPQVMMVGYEGGVKYLGRWLPILKRECNNMGWSFAVNPPSIMHMDLMIAMRDFPGYGPRAWKSNVKLANAQAAGVPIICNREAGYLELAGPGVKWADTEAELTDSMEEMVYYKERCKPLGHAMTVDQCADKVKQWLSSF